MNKWELSYKQDAMIVFCDEGDVYWAKQFATPELLNSIRDDEPFISYLVANCNVFECVLQDFLKKGLNIPPDIFHSVAEGLNDDIVSFLLSVGANINVIKNGLTPLCRAAESHNLRMFEAFLKAGAVVSLKSLEYARKEATWFTAYIRCRMAKDAFVVCAKKHGASRDMINLIGQFIWETRRAEEWQQQNKCSK